MVFVSLLGGCLGESKEATWERISDQQREHAHSRCLAHESLRNYLAQCEHIGATARVERRTYVCHDAEGNRNPSAMGDGPFCVCPERDTVGACLGDTDCSAGVEEKCAPILDAEVVPFFDSDHPLERDGDAHFPGREADASGTGESPSEPAGTR